MKQAIGYIRVSTEKQANEGVSLEAQEAKIVTWCKANGYELVKVYVDAGISGAGIPEEGHGTGELQPVAPGTVNQGRSSHR